MKLLKELFLPAVIAFFSLLFIYTIVGTSANVDTIKATAPSDIESRGWKILGYEGYEYGSWSAHGGKVWYHVQDTLNPHVQYRVYIILWGDELHYYYGEPETIHSVHISDKK